MSKQSSDSFVPDEVDEQIDQHLMHDGDFSTPPVLHRQGEHDVTGQDAYVVQSLQKYYTPARDYAQPMERVWQRLAQERSRVRSANGAIALDRQMLQEGLKSQQNRRKNMQIAQQFPLQKKRFSTAMLIAAIVAFLIVGSSIAIIQLVKPRSQPANHNTQVPAHSTNPSPSPAPLKTELYAQVKQSVYRLNPADDSVLWSYSLPTAKSNEIAPQQGKVIHGVYYTTGPGADGFYIYAVNTTDGSLRWKQNIQAGRMGGPLFSDNTVYVSQGAGDGYTRVTAFNSGTGEIRWNGRYAGDSIDLQAVTDTTLYGTTVIDKKNVLYAIDAPTHQLRWQKDIQLDQTMGQNGQVGQVVDGILYLWTTNANALSYHLYAYNAQTGAAVWDTALDGFADFGATFSMLDGTLYVSTNGDEQMGSGTVYAVGAKDGKVRWQHGTQGGPSAPTVVGGTVYVNVSGKYDASFMHQVVQALDAQTGQVRWSQPASGNLRLQPAPVTDGNFVYVSVEGPKVVVLQASDGKLVNTFTVGDKVPMSAPGNRIALTIALVPTETPSVTNSLTMTVTSNDGGKTLAFYTSGGHVVRNSKGQGAIFASNHTDDKIPLDCGNGSDGPYIDVEAGRTQDVSSFFPGSGQGTCRLKSNPDLSITFTIG